MPGSSVHGILQARKAKTKKWSYIKLKSFTQQGKSSKKN